MSRRITVFAGSTFVVPNPECPNASEHTPIPEGYIARATWFEAKTQTHRQKKCDGCGKFAIWKPRAK